MGTQDETKGEAWRNRDMATKVARKANDKIRDSITPRPVREPPEDSIFLPTTRSQFATELLL